MGLCQNFLDPAEHTECRQGVRYASLAGGGAHYQIFRLPCVPITDRRGEEANRCDQYQACQETGDKTAA